MTKVPPKQKKPMTLSRKNEDGAEQFTLSVYPGARLTAMDLGSAIRWLGDYVVKSDKEDWTEVLYDLYHVRDKTEVF